MRGLLERHMRFFTKGDLQISPEMAERPRVSVHKWIQGRTLTFQVTGTPQVDPNHGPTYRPLDSRLLAKDARYRLRYLPSWPRAGGSRPRLQRSVVCLSLAFGAHLASCCGYDRCLRLETAMVINHGFHVDICILFVQS